MKVAKFLFFVVLSLTSSVSVAGNPGSLIDPSSGLCDNGACDQEDKKEQDDCEAEADFAILGTLN